MMGDKEDNSKCTIYVSNVAAALPPDALRQFFSFCGPLKSLKIVGPAFGAETKYCIVEFTEQEHAKTAALLSGTPLLNKPIQISVTASVIPNSLVATAAVDPSSPPSSTNGPASPTAPPAPLVLTQVPSIAPALAPAPVIPPPTPGAPTSIHAQKAEEVARTVYVGNLNPKITPDHLVKFFSACGPVTFCRMAGDDSHPARFAFIEFETYPAAQVAMTLNGTMLLDRPIKVNHSKNPIVKPPPKPSDPRKEDDAKRALRKAQEALSRKIAASAGGAAVPGSRSRSRSRSRSPRRRSKSRSRSRSRERREQRSRGRDYRDSRDRERERERDRERDRDRDRDRRDRDRDRDRDRERERERDSRRDRDRRDDRDRDRR